MALRISSYSAIYHNDAPVHWTENAMILSFCRNRPASSTSHNLSLHDPSAWRGSLPGVRSTSFDMANSEAGVDDTPGRNVAWDADILMTLTEDAAG